MFQQIREMNLKNAIACCLEQHDRVIPISRRRPLPGLRLRISEAIAPCIFIPLHPFGNQCQSVMHNAFDPLSRQPNHKQFPLKVEHAKGDEQR